MSLFKKKKVDRIESPFYPDISEKNSLSSEQISKSVECLSEREALLQDVVLAARSIMDISNHYLTTTAQVRLRDAISALDAHDNV